MFTLIVSAALVLSNVSLFWVLVNLLKPSQRRLCSDERAPCIRPAPPKSEKFHKWVRARSSLARPGVKVAPLRALKKLKACLCTSTQEEKLPLFQLPSLDYRRGMDVIAKAKNQGTSAKSMSKMHSWPPMEQDIERPMSDLEPVFSAPVLPWGAGLTRTLCPVPEEDPVPRPAAAAKPCCFFEAPVGPADLETQRQAEELRRVLRAMYKTHFQMETNICSGNAQGAFADASLSITPTAEDLKAELLAHSRKPRQRSGLPAIQTGRLGPRSASDAQTALRFTPAQQEPQALMAFPPSVSCPPEFWGEDKPQELCSGRQAKSMEFLLDNLLDLSVAALVSPSGSLGRLTATREDLGFTMRSPFEQLVHPRAALQAA